MLKSRLKFPKLLPFCLINLVYKMKKLALLSVCVPLLVAGCASSLQVSTTPISGQKYTFIADKADNMRIAFRGNGYECVDRYDLEEPVYNSSGMSCSDNKCVFTTGNYHLRSSQGGWIEYNETSYDIDVEESTKGDLKVITYTPVSKTSRIDVGPLGKLLGQAPLESSRTTVDETLSLPQSVKLIFEKEIQSKYQVVDIAGNFNRLGYIDQNQAANAKNQYKLDIKTNDYTAIVPIETFAYRTGSITRVKSFEVSFNNAASERDLAKVKSEIINLITKAVNL